MSSAIIGDDTDYADSNPPQVAIALLDHPDGRLVIRVVYYQFQTELIMTTDAARLLHRMLSHWNDLNPGFDKGQPT